MRKLNVSIETEDRGFGESLSRAVVQCGAAVVGQGDGAGGFFMAGNADINLILLDIRESPDAAIGFLRRVKEGFPDMEVLLINRQDNVRSSMLAMQAGACDELMAPVDKKTLREKLESAAKRLIKRKTKSIFEKFSNAMVAATFAEAGEFETARDLMNEESSQEPENLHEDDIHDNQDH